MHQPPPSNFWPVPYGSSFVYVQSKRRLLHKRFARKKCFYVVQRQITFSRSLHNNPPSMGNCKLLVVIITERLHLIQRRSHETDTKWTPLLSWKHLTGVHQNLIFEMGKNLWRAWLVTAVTPRYKFYHLFIPSNWNVLSSWLKNEIKQLFYLSPRIPYNLLPWN